MILVGCLDLEKSDGEKVRRGSPTGPRHTERSVWRVVAAPK